MDNSSEFYFLLVKELIELSSSLHSLLRTWLPEPWNIFNNSNKDLCVILNSLTYLLVYFSFLFWFMRKTIEVFIRNINSDLSGKDKALVAACSLGPSAGVLWPALLFLTHLLTCRFYPYVIVASVLFLFFPAFIMREIASQIQRAFDSFSSPPHGTAGDSIRPHPVQPTGPLGASVDFTINLSNGPVRLRLQEIGNLGDPLRIDARSEPDFSSNEDSQRIQIDPVFFERRTEADMEDIIIQAGNRSNSEDQIIQSMENRSREGVSAFHPAHMISNEQVMNVQPMSVSRERVDSFQPAQMVSSEEVQSFQPVQMTGSGEVRNFQPAQMASSRDVRSFQPAQIIINEREYGLQSAPTPSGERVNESLSRRSSEGPESQLVKTAKSQEVQRVKPIKPKSFRSLPRNVFGNKLGYCGRCWRVNNLPFRPGFSQLREPYVTRSGTPYGPTRYFLTDEEFIRQYAL